jgi:hypothetical protein
MEYTNMSIIFIVKHFKQIATRVKPQADITVAAVLKRAVIAGICKRMANIGFAYTMPESRLSELNIKVHPLTIAVMKRERKATPQSGVLPDCGAGVCCANSTAPPEAERCCYSYGALLRLKPSRRFSVRRLLVCAGRCYLCWDTAP